MTATITTTSFKALNYNSLFRRLFVSAMLCLLFFPVSAQVTFRERTRWTWMAKGGAMANNPDNMAQLWMKDNLFGDGGWMVKPYYAALPELQVSFDAVKLRGAIIGLSLSGMYSETELNASSRDQKFLLGLMPTEMLRGTLTLSFNGSDRYTMFEMPYHSQNEAVLGVTAIGMRSEDAPVSARGRDSLGVTSIKGGISKAAGIYFGLNWRIGQSGWVFGVSASLMWNVDGNHWATVKTDDSSVYTSGYIDMAPRIAQAGLGYHF